LTVGDFGRTASIYNLLSQCGRFGLSSDKARKEIDNVVEVVRGWREHFFASGVSAKDVAYITPAILPECFFFERQPEAFTG
jgi:serine/threonine-protein kinase HipA